MNNSRLPIEIWEHIIDSCRKPQDWYERMWYHTWRQTALVCSAWLPRSRLNLLYEVELRDTSSVDLLLRTLQETQHFADMVIRLTVSAGHTRYVPFARMPLPLLLKKCVAVDLDLVDWTVYPPRYANTGLYALSEIVELRLNLDSINLQASVRLFWSLHHLRTLRLNQRWRRSMREGAVDTRSDLTMWCPGPKTGKCESLRTLEYEVQ